MTVEQNLTYSLKINGVGKAERKKAADEVAAVTGLKELLHRYPRELSGGQRQRVAMSRAIIRNPKAFLFDEPLSNLDAALRVHMRKEIRALHDRLGATSVYVTHDQVEAMTMADHVVVMRNGVIEQQGAPLDLYDHPANRFVAGFIGSPAMNFVTARSSSDGGSLILELGSAQVMKSPAQLPPDHLFVVGIRPEHFRLAGPGEAGLELDVAAVESTGAATYVTTATSPEIVVVLNGRSPIGSGHRIHLEVDPDHIHLFDAQTHRRIDLLA